ncbi:uncharacterized protein fam83ha [Polymixia lowei]
MARRSQCSSAGDNPLDPNYLPPHYREEYRLAIDALVEENLEGYYQFLQRADVVDFLSVQEIEHIQSNVQVPHERNHSEQRYLESEGDGSSDTYWPIHSDLDAPGLDLGWPQVHHFIGPTEVTTLINPAEPDMPSIKEQARRLIKNAQQVVAIVMDVFTDVDIFAEILEAAMRNVAVYILLDEQNAHHFINMVSNCRVNLESIQFLRVRTVSGVTYHCRSGKSFKGQMMDRFLLTDCRAVLSGNYSFMWSFEKLHRCLAHLFLGHLVSTFDEEFRILYAQSQPLMIEKALAPMEDIGHLPERQYTIDKTSMYREPRKYIPIGSSNPEEWARHYPEERMDMDWKRTPISRHGPMHRSQDQGPVDLYNKYPSQQIRMDQSCEQGSSRMPKNVAENPAFKRHSYAEGIHGRQPYQFMQQQGMPNVENQGRQFHKAQHPHPRTGPEAGYSGYDRLRGHAHHQADQYPEPGLQQDMEPPDSYDLVFNYLSSTSNVEFDQDSDQLLPPAELPFGFSHPRRVSVGTPYACETSPTNPNPPDQKEFFQEPNVDRKDPAVKQGLRNWRISSYLSAFDNAGDEGLPLPPPQSADPFDEPPKPLHQMTSGPDSSVPKFPNASEFKIPAEPRASKLQSYIKLTVPESSKKLLDDFVTMAAETKTTPTTPSESSSTTEGDKTDDFEPKEPKEAVVQRGESFRRKYNAAVQRGSRLRSSLIFSSQLEQQVSQDLKTAPGQQDEDTDKNETDWSKLPFASKVLGQRKREPFEWSRYLKPDTFDNSTAQTSKADDMDNKEDIKDSKPTEAEQAKLSPSMPQPSASQVEPPKIDQPLHPPETLLSNPSSVDMSDPDNRLMVFKELAAKRKAAKAAAAQKDIEKAPSDSKNTTVKREEPAPEEVSQSLADSSSKKPTTLCETITQKNAQDVMDKTSTETRRPVSLHLNVSDKTSKQEHHPKSGSDTLASCEKEPRGASTDSEKIEFKNSQASVSAPVPAKSAQSHSQPSKEPRLSDPAVKDCSQFQSPTIPNAKSSTVSSSTDSIAQRAHLTDKHESPNLDSTLNESSPKPSSVELPPSSKSATVETIIQPLGSPQLESSTSSPTTPSGSSAGPHPIGSESSSSYSIPSESSSSSKHILPDSSSSQNIPFDSSPSPSSTPSLSSSALHSNPLESISSNISPSDQRSAPLPSILSPKSDKTNKTEQRKSLSSSPLESSLSTNQTPQESTSSSITQSVLSSDPTQVKPDSMTQCAPSDAPSTRGLVHAESNISSDTKDLVLNTSLLQSATKTYCEESCASGPSSKTELPDSESNSVQKPVPAEPGFKGECNVSPSVSHLSSNSVHSKPCSPIMSAPESFDSPAIPDQKKPATSNLTPAEPPPENTPTETSSVLNPAPDSNFSPDASSPKSNASLTLALTQAASPSELPPLGSSALSPAAAVSCSSPLSSADGLIVSPKLEKRETAMSPIAGPSETSSLPELTPTDLGKCPVLMSTESSSDSQTETTSKVTPVPSKPNMACKTPTESKSITSESHPSETSVPIEKSNMGNQSEVNKEPGSLDSVADKKTGEAETANTGNATSSQDSVHHGKPSDQAREMNSAETAEVASDEVVPLSPQSKQSKASQTRYHSSTANVLSSSNLRDDTKLLLEQISANSQCRGEPAKESAVTDDDKEGEADKIVNRGKRGSSRSLSKGQPKNAQEREKLLEKLQSRRKEGKVYSRFEMGP